jgi:hypothetical protein
VYLGGYESGRITKLWPAMTWYTFLCTSRPPKGSDGASLIDNNEFRRRVITLEAPRPQSTALTSCLIGKMPSRTQIRLSCGQGIALADYAPSSNKILAEPCAALRPAKLSLMRGREAFLHPEMLVSPRDHGSKEPAPKNPQFKADPAPKLPRPP